MPETMLLNGSITVRPNEVLQKILNKEKIEEQSPVDEEVPIEVSEGKGMIRFLCNKQTSKEITGNGIDGDDRIVWDRRILETIKEARDKFNELIRRGYVAFCVKRDGQKSNQFIRR